MKFYEYMTFFIIGSLAFNLIIGLFNKDYNVIGLSITGLIGWLYVSDYEKQERKARLKREREHIQYDV